MTTKNKYLTILFYLIIFTFLFSCKKYENGPLISLRSKENRLCKKWVLNGANYPIIEFRKDGTFLHTVYYSNIDFDTCYIGTWEFVDKDKNIYILMPLGSGSFSDHINSGRKYILRLTKNELWLLESVNIGGLDPIYGLIEKKYVPL